jgi:glycerophosphoryl diester phosphodiesterase
MAALIILPAVAAAFFILYFILTAGEPVKSWINEYRYAHRGLHGGPIPENSMAAFELAVEKGYGIELDVHLSRDGLPVVFHDDNLKRMTGIDRLISDLNFEELAALRLADSSEGIPLFSDVLQLVAGQVPILVELKNTGGAGELEEKTYELLKNYGGKYAVQSFSPFSVKWFRINAPDVLRGQLASRFDDMHDSLPAYQIFGLKNLLVNVLARPNFISYEINSLPRKVVSRLRRKGVYVLGWTVRSEEQREKAARYCDTMIFENIAP